MQHKHEKSSAFLAQQQSSEPACSYHNCVNMCLDEKQDGTEGGKSVPVLLVIKQSGEGKRPVSLLMSVSERVIFLSFHFYKQLNILEVLSYLILNNFCESARFEQKHAQFSPKAMRLRCLQPTHLRGDKRAGSVLVSVAQWIAHRTSNPGVVGSSPTVDAIFAFSLKYSSYRLSP